MSLINKVIRFKQFFILLLLIALVSLAQSCGFQLRGALDISQDISPLYLQSNSAFDLAREIKQLLASNKIDVTDNISKANSQLILLNENRGRRVLSVDSNGRVREYLLTYTVNFSIQFNNDNGRQPRSQNTNNQLVDEQADDQQKVEEAETISVKRTLLFDQNAVLAVTNESEILYKDMRRDTARLILLKVKALSTITESISAESPEAVPKKTESVPAEPEKIEPVSESTNQPAPIAK